MTALENDRNLQKEPVQRMYDYYRKLKEQLGKYVAELHKPRDTMKRSTYEIQDLLAKIKVVPSIACLFPFNHILEVEQNHENKLIDLIEKISSLEVAR